MKTNDDQQNRQFEKQLTHLHSFIGMPTRIARKPSPSEIRENDRHLLEQQAMEFEAERKNFLRRLFIALINTSSLQLRQVTKTLKEFSKKKASVRTSTECL